MKIFSRFNPNGRLFFIACALLFSGLMGVLLTPALAGTISGQQVTDAANYEFAKCQKPAEPFTTVDGDQPYNEAVAQFNQYIEEINSYMVCITEEANADIAVQIELIEQAHQRQIDLVKQDSEAGKVHLETLRANEN